MENLENSRNRKKELVEAYRRLYADSLYRTIEEYELGDSCRFDDVDEEVLQELDKEVEPNLEECFPDLIIKRVAGFEWLIVPRDKVDEWLDE